MGASIKYERPPVEVRLAAPVGPPVPCVESTGGAAGGAGVSGVVDTGVSAGASPSGSAAGCISPLLGVACGSVGCGLATTGSSGAAAGVISCAGNTEFELACVGASREGSEEPQADPNRATQNAELRREKERTPRSLEMLTQVRVRLPLLDWQQGTQPASRARLGGLGVWITFSRTD